MSNAASTRSPAELAALLDAGLTFIRECSGLMLVSRNRASIVYHDDATQRCYRVTLAAVRGLGDHARRGTRDLYSTWCAETLAVVVPCRHD